MQERIQQTTGREKKASNRSDANATLHAKETLHVVDETVKSDSGVTDENREMSENCSDANATLHAKEILHAVEETVKSDLILSAKHCLHANESKKKNERCLSRKLMKKTKMQE